MMRRPGSEDFSSISLVRALPWKVIFAIPWLIFCREGQGWGGQVVGQDGGGHSKWEEGNFRGKEREKGNGGRDKGKRRGRELKVDFRNLLEAGKRVPAKGWVSLGWGRTEGDVQDRGNTRGWGFVSGQTQELEGASRNQDSYSSAHSRTPPSGSFLADAHLTRS